MCQGSQEDGPPGRLPRGCAAQLQGVWPAESFQLSAPPGSALPAEHHITWGYVLPRAACLQQLNHTGSSYSRAFHQVGQGSASPELQPDFSLAQSCFIPTSFHSKYIALQALSQCPLPENTICNTCLFFDILSCSIYHKSQENACVYPFSGIIVILKSTFFRV